jgi:hypothetical protein
MPVDATRGLTQLALCTTLEGEDHYCRLIGPMANE